MTGTFSPQEGNDAVMDFPLSHIYRMLLEFTVCVLVLFGQRKQKLCIFFIFWSLDLYFGITTLNSGCMDIKSHFYRLT